MDPPAMLENASNFVAENIIQTNAKTATSNQIVFVEDGGEYSSNVQINAKKYIHYEPPVSYRTLLLLSVLSTLLLARLCLRPTQVDLKNANTLGPSSLPYLPLLDTLPKNPDTSGIQAEYLPHSRANDEEAVWRWLDDSSSELILWIYAAAGVGKSTLARHLQQELRAKDQLGASVFLGYGPPDSWGPSTVIELIANELRKLHPGVAVDVEKAIHQCHGATLQTQLENFIRDPLLRLNLPHPLVVILDAVDEWYPRHAFVNELAFLNTYTSLVRFIVLGRTSPEERLLKLVSIRLYQLPPVSTAVLEQYIQTRFNLMQWDYGRQPPPEDISRFAEKADGLFVWVATACSLIEDSWSTGPPQDIIAAILDDRHSVGGIGHLAKVYHQAITSRFPDPKHQEVLRTFLGATMVLQEPLPILDFSLLVGLNQAVVEKIQDRLRALQTRRPTDSKPMVHPASTTFHRSFIEYLQSTSTPPGAAFTISLEGPHRSLGLASIAELTRFLPAQNLSSLYLSPLRNYAVRHWPLHMTNSAPPAQLARHAYWLHTVRCSTLLDPAKQAVRFHWAVLFLNTAIPGSNVKEETLGEGDLAALLRHVAAALREAGMQALPFRIPCLEVAVRLQWNDADIWRELGQAYTELWDYTSSAESLHKAVAAHEYALRALEETLGTRSDRANFLFYLAKSLWQRFNHVGDPTDIDQSILLYREALVLYRGDNLATMVNLALALQSRFEFHGSSADLKEAISLSEATLAALPPGDADRPVHLNALALGLRRRFRDQGTTVDLSRAISLQVEALALRVLVPDHPPQSISLSLGNSFFLRYERTRSPGDLDNAFAYYKEGLDIHPPGDQSHWLCLSGIANCLESRFAEDQTRVEDLEQAITSRRRVLAFFPHSHPRSAMARNNLARSLSIRFKFTGVIVDLEEAIDQLKKSLSFLTAGHRDRPGVLINLGSAIQERFKHLGDVEDREQADLLFREAIHLLPRGHPDWCSIPILALSPKTSFEEAVSPTAAEDNTTFCFDIINTLHYVSMHNTPSGCPHPE